MITRTALPLSRIYWTSTKVLPDVKTTTRVLPDGFGTRLREERERLGLTQDQLASVAGIKRITQGQYERQLSTPTLRYLGDVAGAGVNLDYVIWGRQTGEKILIPELQREIEQRAFQVVEEYASKVIGVPMTASNRYALFEVLRAQMINTTVQP